MNFQLDLLLDLPNITVKHFGSLGIAPQIVYWYTIMTLPVRQNHCTARVLLI